MLEGHVFMYQTADTVLRPNKPPSSYHLHHLHLRIDAQMIEEGDEVLPHLDAVVVHLSNSENPHLALSPNLDSVNIL